MNPVKAVLQFASALYLFGLVLIMIRALRAGSLLIVPDALFQYELILIVGLVLFQGFLFVSEIISH